MRAIRKPKDLLAGLVFLTIGIGAFAVARTYEIGTASRMGTGYFPALMGIVIAGLGAILLVRAFFGVREPGPTLALRGPASILAASLLYAGLLRPFGIVVATLVLVGVAATGSSASRPGHTALLAVGLAAGCVLVFAWGLGQPIPVLGSAFGAWAW